MSLMDALNESINKSVTAEKSAVQPKPETKEAKPATEVEEHEESPIEEVQEEEQELSDDIEDEEEQIDDDEEEIAEDDDEEALSSKYKTEEKQKVAAPKMVKIIEDGIERKISLEELKKGYQKGSVSGKRFDEAAKMLKEAQQIRGESQDFVELLELSPIAGLYEVLGAEATTRALEQYRHEMNAFEQMDETQKENFLHRKNRELQDTVSKFKTNMKTEIITDEAAQVIGETLTQRFNQVVENVGFKTNGLKKALLEKMKGYARHKSGDKALEIEEIEMLADRVKEEYKTQFTQDLSSMSDSDLIEFLGGDVVEKVRKHLVSKFKTKKAEKVTPTKDIKPKIKPDASQKTRADYNDFWKNPGQS